MKIREWVQWFSVPALLVGCALLLILCMCHIDSTSQTATDDSGYSENSYILIDAGHGGVDGGAVGADGTQEKDINLLISQSLSDMVKVFGYEVRMTRSSDISLHDDSCDTIREKKVSDMKARLTLYNNAALTVSIHQNNFGSAQYSGTQLFYSANNTASQALGDAIRKSVVKLLQPKNTRELKKGSSDIYLLHKTTAPAVIVECGFLSNTAELVKLKTAEYQQQMAFAIMSGVLDYAP